MNKSEGIVGAEDKDDVQNRLQECRVDLDDKETLPLQKKEGYVPQFSKYLADRQELIGKCMSKTKSANACWRDGKTYSYVYEFIWVHEKCYVWSRQISWNSTTKAKTRTFPSLNSQNMFWRDPWKRDAGDEVIVMRPEWRLQNCGTLSCTRGYLVWLE